MRVGQRCMFVLRRRVLPLSEIYSAAGGRELGDVRIKELRRQVVSAEKVPVNRDRLLIFMEDRRQREHQQARAPGSGATGYAGAGPGGIQQPAVLPLLVEKVHRYRIDRRRAYAKGRAK